MPDETSSGRDMRGEGRIGGVDHWIAALAGRQHGVLARSQLVDAGLSGDMIDRRIACGRLHPMYRGVYAVGHRLVSREGRWMAAVLAGGERAVLSHRSAAELWGLMRPTSGRPEVTLPRSRHRRRTVGIVWHSSPLPSDEVVAVSGIPVTAVPRTLLDLASVLDRRGLERAMNEAELRESADALPCPPSLPAIGGDAGLPLSERSSRRRSWVGRGRGASWRSGSSGSCDGVGCRFRR
jgi:hypothetical protein